jgi:hypothetical protein
MTHQVSDLHDRLFRAFQQSVLKTGDHLEQRGKNPVLSSLPVKMSKNVGQMKIEE